MRHSIIMLMLAACSDGPSVANQLPTPDGGTGDETSVVDASPVEAATDAAQTFPASHPAMPTVVSEGGPVIASPKIVPVFFMGDAIQASLEKFLNALGPSAYWTAIGQEYGVGAAASQASVLVTTPAPTSITDDEIQTWLAAQTDGTHAGWPKADPNTIFTLFYPSGTHVSVHGKNSCTYFDGYHHEGMAADGSPLIYAVTVRCVAPSQVLDEVTVAASHEIIEAATDPRYNSNRAYTAEDSDHLIWTLTTAGEVGDMCVLEPQANQTLVGSFLVQRSWSNAAAKAGHDPCVPALSQPYFTAEAVLTETATIDNGQGPLSTKGIHIATGDTKTVDVQLFSDAPTSPWQVQATDTSVLYGGSAELQFSFDKETGANGDVLHLSIKRLQAGSFGGSGLVLKSVLGSTTHLWLGFVAN